MKRFIPLIIAVTVILGPLLLTHSCASVKEAPTGGDKDTIPPYITNITPLPGTVGVPLEGVKFVFTFNEYVTIKTSTNIFLSPPLRKPAKSKLKGKSLIVSFEEPFEPNTTYTISFTDAIADNNEGNMFAGYTYVFSTGEKIDSMMLTGTILDCNTLAPIKGATVLLHKDSADSAIFLHRPYAATKTDDWGYFVLPFIQDTSYRLYAIRDDNNNNIYDPDAEIVGFVDSTVRPVMWANDTVKEILRYDMKDTLACSERKSEYEITLFREKPSKQYLVNKERSAERAAYLTFMAPGAEIDSLDIEGFRQSQIISQFNIQRDCLELWINSRRAVPDTMKISLLYRKTDSLGVLKPTQESVKLTLPNEKRTFSKTPRRNLKHNDTTCVYTLKADPTTIEQVGYSLEFKYPIISESFADVSLKAISPKQAETQVPFDVVRDTLNLRHYTLMPKDKFLNGYEYILKIPHHAFRDINGFYSDSTSLKCTLPTDETLSTLEAVFSGVDRKYIVDLLGEKRDKVLRSYILEKDETLLFPYLKEGKYSLRITEDGNRNSIIDTGSVLEHRQAEKVKFYELGNKTYIELPAGTELVQNIDLKQLFQ